MSCGGLYQSQAPPPPEVCVSRSAASIRRLAPACSAAEGASVSGFHSPFSQSGGPRCREVKEISRFHSPLPAQLRSAAHQGSLIGQPGCLLPGPYSTVRAPVPRKGAALGMQAAVALGGAVERNRVETLGP